MTASTWTAVGAVAGGLAFVAMIVIGYLTIRGPKRRLIVSRDDVVRLSAPGWADLTISHDQMALKEPTFVTYFIVNSSREPVRAADWSDLAVDVTAPAKLVTGVVQHIQRNHGPVRLTASLEDDKLAITPLLLNPKEGITIQILVDASSADDVTASVRAAGFETVAAGTRDEFVSAVLPPLVAAIRSALPVRLF